MKLPVAILALLVILGVAGCDGSVPEGGGPAVLDEAGIVADWEFIMGIDEPLPAHLPLDLPDLPLRVVPAAPESTELVVVWLASPCQLEPVAQVTSLDGGIHIEVRPGPYSEQFCHASAAGYGFIFTLTEPLGERVVTAELVDERHSD